MTTYDNGEPLPDWQPDPRPSPFEASESAVTIGDNIVLGDN